MDNIERRDREMAYISDESVMEEQKVCRRILQRLNTVDRSDFDEIGKSSKSSSGSRTEHLLIRRSTVITVPTSK